MTRNRKAISGITKKIEKMTVTDLKTELIINFVLRTVAETPEDKAPDYSKRLFTNPIVAEVFETMTDELEDRIADKLDSMGNDFIVSDWFLTVFNTFRLWKSGSNRN